jgi:DegV family protein with EDD domain
MERDGLQAVPFRVICGGGYKSNEAGIAGPARPKVAHSHVAIAGGRMSVLVVTDSSSCLSREDLERLHITAVPLYVSENGRSTPEPEVDVADLYERITGMASLPTTSQPTPAELSDAFSGAAERGADVLGVFISSKMSSTLATAEGAAASIRAQYPRARIALVDSESNSLQEGYAVLSAAECAANGGELGECEAAARATIRRTRFLFAPQGLENLARGGRISGAARLLGATLRIVPVLTAEDGTTSVVAAVRTQGRALRRIAERMSADVGRFGLRRAAVQVIADDAGAAAFAREMIEPIAGSPVDVVPVGPAVGIHVGPAIGVVYETIEPMR